MPRLKNCPPNTYSEGVKGSRAEGVITHGLVLQYSAGMISSEVIACVVDELMLAYAKQKPSFHGLRNITDFRNFLESTLHGKDEETAHPETRPEKLQKAF